MPSRVSALGKVFFQVNDVATLSVIDATRPADFGRIRARKVLDLTALDDFLHVSFGFVGQFETVAREDFDTIVFMGVVRCGDDYAGIGAHAAGDERDSGGGAEGPTSNTSTPMEQIPDVMAVSII